MKICIDYFQKIKTEKEQKKLLILGDMKELGENSLNYHIELLEYIVMKKLSNVIICGELLKIALDKICNKNILKKGSYILLNAVYYDYAAFSRFVVQSRLLFEDQAGIFYLLLPVLNILSPPASIADAIEI